MTAEGFWSSTRFTIFRGDDEPAIGEIISAPEKLYYTVGGAMGQSRTRGHWLIELEPAGADWRIVMVRRLTR